MVDTSQFPELALEQIGMRSGDKEYKELKEALEHVMSTLSVRPLLTWWCSEAPVLRSTLQPNAEEMSLIPAFLKDPGVAVKSEPIEPTQASDKFDLSALFGKKTAAAASPRQATKRVSLNIAKVQSTAEVSAPFRNRLSHVQSQPAAEQHQQKRAYGLTARSITEKKNKRRNRWKSHQRQKQREPQLRNVGDAVAMARAAASAASTTHELFTRPLTTSSTKKRKRAPANVTQQAAQLVQNANSVHTKRNDQFLSLNG